MMNATETITLDSIAKRLAADRGQVWSDLAEFPGYARNIWRDEARRQVLREMPGAVFEILPSRWDGRESGYLVRMPA